MESTACPIPEFAPIFGIIIFAVAMFFILLTVLFQLLLWWKIFSKAGFSGALGLLIFVPFGPMIMLCIMAFSKWPILNPPQS